MPVFLALWQFQQRPVVGGLVSLAVSVDGPFETRARAVCTATVLYPQCVWEVVEAAAASAVVAVYTTPPRLGDSRLRFDCFFGGLPPCQNADEYQAFVERYSLAEASRGCTVTYHGGGRRLQVVFQRNRAVTIACEYQRDNASRVLHEARIAMRELDVLGFLPRGVAPDNRQHRTTFVDGDGEVVRTADYVYVLAGNDWVLVDQRRTVAAAWKADRE